MVVELVGLGLGGVGEQLHQDGEVKGLPQDGGEKELQLVDDERDQDGGKPENKNHFNILKVKSCKQKRNMSSECIIAKILLRQNQQKQVCRNNAL